jgi:hypothetical protein
MLRYTPCNIVIYSAKQKVGYFSWPTLYKTTNYILKSLAETTDEAPMHRGKFTMKLMKLTLQGPSLVQAPSKALGGALNKYSLSCLILYL